VILFGKPVNADMSTDWYKEVRRYCHQKFNAF